MAEIERLEILIDVVDRFSAKLDQLLLKLGEVEAVAEKVEDITIDVDVRGERQLDALMARLAAVGAFDAGTTDVNVRAAGVTGAGGAATAAQTADAAEDATDSIKRAAGVMDEMGDNADLFNLRMSDLHNLLAKLVPLLLTFIGAIPALLSALVVLATAAVAAAAALFALGAFGALGFAIQRGGMDEIGEGFREILDEIRNDFLDAFAPLAERLAPMFEDALDGLDMLFQAIADRGDVLVGLQDVAEDFGAFMLDLIPDLLADMGRMADAFAPLFGALADIFDFNVLAAFSQFMAEAADEIVLFTELLVRFIPTIAELSLGFLQVVNVIGAVVHGFSVLLSILPIGADAIGALIGTIFTLITVISIWRAVQGSALLSTIAATIPSIAALITTIDIYIISALVAAGASGTLAAAISALLIATGIGAVLLALGAAVGVMADSFSSAESDIKSATDALREFDGVSSRMSGEGRFGVDPSTASRRASPRSRRGGGVTVVVEGNADEDVVRRQSQNATYRLNRPRQSGV